MELSSELRYQLLKILERNPDASQRDLAQALGVSLGKINYCLQTLVTKGLIKARNFKNSRNKLAYMYYLTPAGVEEKSRVTFQFLRKKLAEVEQLQEEIEVIRSETRRKNRS
ncbi:MAG TPA: MarR family EPS-associated transcriptional regulator [Thermoanaerobaculia bacterium]|nr:MarR family EPS-associated transcriptional regulator [Thermoanaerobaculia bacterium]